MKLILSVCLLAFLVVVQARGQGDIPFPVQCAAATPTPKPSSVAECSYVALNGTCTITIDRLNPITPPTIYAKRDAVITVEVVNPSPFENLTLDWKSTTAVLPPDVFSTIFSAITPSLGKITVVTARGLVLGPAEISQQQKTLLDKIQAPLYAAAPAVQATKSALLPPPLGSCPKSDPPEAETWVNLATWQNQVKTGLYEAIEQANQPTAPLQNDFDAIAAEISQLNVAKDDKDGQRELVILNVNQSVLKDALTRRDPQNLVPRFTALILAVDQIPPIGSSGPKLPATIQAFSSNDHNYQSQVWGWCPARS